MIITIVTMITMMILNHDYGDDDWKKKELKEERMTELFQSQAQVKEKRAARISLCVTFSASGLIPDSPETLSRR